MMKAVYLFTFLLFTFHLSAAQTIRIDGQINEAAWTKAQPVGNFKTLKGKEPQAQTTGLVLADADTLYLAFRCEEPLMEKPELTPLPRDGNPWINDCLEIFIAPFQQREKYFHIVVDAKGQVYDALVRDKNYDLNIISKAQKQRNSWSVELAIPLADLGLSQARGALMNFCRERKPVLEDTSWHGGFHQPQSWQTVSLNINAKYDVDIRDWNFEIPFPQYGKNNLTVKFITGEEAPINILLYEQESLSWKLINQKTISSQKGNLTRVSLPYSLTSQHKPQALRCEITQNKNLLFRSSIRPELPAALAASLSLPYYYSEEKQGRIQLNNFVTDASLNSGEVRLTVHDPAGKTVSSEHIRPLKKSMSAGFDISSWQTGNGKIVVELMVDGAMLARQTFTIIKQPGPFMPLPR